MDEKIKWMVSAILGLLSAFTEKYGMMILLVAVAIAFDCVTGLIKARTQGNINSKDGTRGFFKKISLLVCLFFGFFLDYAIMFMCKYITLDIPHKLPFGMIICFYIVINESISICENLYACNSAIMPKWIVKVLLSAKEKLDDAGEMKNDDSKDS